MGIAAVAEELAAIDELDELYKLSASETGPEDDEHAEEEDKGEEEEPEVMGQP
jgi:hypothetical protein